MANGTESIMALAMTFTMAFTVAFSITLMVLTIRRYIGIVVPIVTHEIDRATASIISATMLGPLFGMTGRHMQIEGLIDHTHRHRPHDHGLGINHLGTRIIADIYGAVKAGLAHAY